MKLTVEFIKKRLERVLIIELDGIGLYYTHDPKLRGYVLVNGPKRDVKFVGGNMRDACRIFNETIGEPS